MILTGNDIRDERRAGRLLISPFDDSLVNPNSYNYRLGPTLLLHAVDEIDPWRETPVQRVQIPSDGYVLAPYQLYLGSTMESIGSDHFVTTLIGRSSLGRLGLFLQITADLGHLGAAHCWTLEMHVVQPLRVYAGMKIGQVSFWRVDGDPSHLYAGKYGQHQLPMPSAMHRETPPTGT